MSAIKLHVIKPSVNNMTARVFVRAAKLEFTEDDVYGKTRSPEFMGKNPAHLTPMMEAPGLPKGVMWESCAIMQYLCNKHHLDTFYPTEPEKRAMVDSAMFYIVGTIYPYLARATYGALGLPALCRRRRRERRGRGGQGQGAEGGGRGAGRDALRLPQVLPARGDLCRRRPCLDRRHPPRLQPRVPQRDRLPVRRLDQSLYGRRREGARRRLRRAGGGRSRLHPVREGEEGVGSLELRRDKLRAALRGPVA